MKSFRPIAFALTACFVWISLHAVVVQSTWGQRNLRDIPDPDPELERRTFTIPDGFEVNLYASDPLIAKPIQMNFDAEGRLWIASSEVYPHIKPGQKATDKILVLEDVDGDGTADKTTTFADGLLIPTGVIPGDGGCYVANSTELIHFSDTDGDGKSDRKRVVLSGFGTEDTHHLLHTLRWGPDGMLYMNQSIYIHSHVETPFGVRHLNGGGIWRFRPETMELDVLCHGFVNSWGHHFDQYGQSFATDGAYGEGINYVFPGSVFVSSPNAKRIMRGLNPGSPKHCGLEVVGGTHLPPEWRGNMITNDFRAHRVCRFVISEDGSGYASRQEQELIKSTHVAFRPIDVKMGPDGAIYIADWYNPIIQHGEVDFRDPRRDHVSGRIWRLTVKDRPLVEKPPIVGAPLDDLVGLLASEQPWQRLFAKLEMKTRPASDVSLALQNWLDELDPSDASYDFRRLEALWAFQSIRVIRPELVDALLNSSDHRVRAAATRVCIQWFNELPQAERWLAAGARDEHPRVRLESIRGLAEMGSVEATMAAAQAFDFPLDRFLDFAMWRTMRDLSGAWMPALQEGVDAFEGKTGNLLYALAAVDSAAIVPALMNLVEQRSLNVAETETAMSLLARHAGPAELEFVVRRALDGADTTPGRAASLLNALRNSTRERNLVPAGDLSGLLAVARQGKSPVNDAALRCLGAWKVKRGEQLLMDLIDSPESIDRARLALDGLVAYGGQTNADRLVELSSDATRLAIRTHAITALTRLDLQRAVQAAVELLAEERSNIDPSPIVQAIVAVREGPDVFARALEGQSIDPARGKLIMQAAQRVNRLPDHLANAIRISASLDSAGWSLTPELMERLVTRVGESGDPHRGESVYRRKELQCLQCHAIGGAGGDVGPDMISIGASAQVDYLVESLLDPDAKIKENFHSKTIVTLDGLVVTGIIRSTSDGILSVKLADGELQRIREEDVDEIVDGPSLMTKGLIDNLPEQDLVDLVAFLSRLGKSGDFAVGNERYVRNWQSLVWTEDGHRRLNRTSYDTAATDDEALTWRPEYSLVSGGLPIAALAPFRVHAHLDPTSFLRFRFDVSSAGNTDLVLNQSDGLSMWVDGKPTPVDEVVNLSFESGEHQITLAVNREERKSPVRVELREPAENPAQLQLLGN